MEEFEHFVSEHYNFLQFAYYKSKLNYGSNSALAYLQNAGRP